MEIYTKSVLSLFWERGAGSILLRPSTPRLYSAIKSSFLGALPFWRKKGGKIGPVDTRVPEESGWPEGEGRGRNAKSWLWPQTPDPGLSSGRPVGSQPWCSLEPAAWQHPGHREGLGDPKRTGQWR